MFLVNTEFSQEFFFVVVREREMSDKIHTFLTGSVAARDISRQQEKSFSSAQNQVAFPQAPNQRML